MILLRSLAFQAAFYLWTFVLGILALPLLLAPGSWVMRFGILWSAGTLRLLGWCTGLRHEVIGRENLPAGPCLIAMKHQSAWDTFAVPVIFDGPAMVMKRELGLIPFYGWYARKAGMIPVDRNGGGAALKSMLKEAEAACAAGRPILIFPEGTRTAVGHRMDYHPGVIALYRHLGVPLVPVALDSGLFWGRRWLTKRPGLITIQILPPLPPGGDRRVTMRKLEDAIEDATARLVASAQARQPCG